MTKEQKAKEGHKFKECLDKYCYGGIGSELSDEVAYKMMCELSFNVTANNNYYSKRLIEARNFESKGDREKMKEYDQDLIEMVREYLQLSGKNKKYIDENLIPMMHFFQQFFCDTGSINKIMNDFNDLNFKPAEKTLKRR